MYNFEKKEIFGTDETGRMTAEIQRTRCRTDKMETPMC